MREFQALFKYSGNKNRMLSLYRPPPAGVTRVVEPYLGSGAYVLNQPHLRGLGFDLNPYVVDLWTWLQSTDADTLRALDRKLKDAKQKTLKPDIREMGLERGEMLYLKVNVCGLVVGQWSSWGVYPQHHLPLDRTIASLSDARRVEVRLASATQYEPQQGDMLFVDPPYVNTSGNYLNEGGYNPQNTLDLLDRCKGMPVVFTYGDGAPDVFPGLPWEVVSVRQVPNFRRGGVVTRKEYVAYLNWPKDDPVVTSLNLFE